MTAEDDLRKSLLRKTKAELVEELLDLRQGRALSAASQLPSDQSCAPFPINIDESSITNLAADVNSHEFLKLVVESTPQYIYWKDVEGRYLGCNLNFARAAGVGTPDQIIGLKDADLAWGAGDAELYVETDLKVIRENRPSLHKVRPFRGSDGSTRIIDSSKAPLRDKSGNVIGIIGFFDDVTALKRNEEELIRHRDRLEQLVEERTEAIKQEIEARHATEKALRDSENRLQAALGSMSGGFMVVDQELTLIAYNRRFRELYQLPDEMVRTGINLTEIFQFRADRGDYGPGLTKDLVRRRARSYREDGLMVYEDRVPGGVLEVYRSPTEDGGVVAVFNDITTRKKAEQKLQEREAFLQSILATSQQGYWQIDKNKRTVDVNESLCLMFGRDREDIMGKTPMDFIAPGQEEELVARINMRETQSRRTFPMDYLKKDGSLLRTVVHATALYAPDGTVTGSFAFLSDVTELHDQQQLLQANERRLIRILNASPIAVGISSVASGKILFANQRSADMFGYPDVESLLGQTTLDHWVEIEQREVFREIMRTEGRVASREMRMRDLTGREYWVLTSWDPIHHEGQDCILFWAYDVTEIKDAQVNLEKLNQDLHLEAEERRQAQLALQDTLAHLEERVRERTVELEQEIKRADYANRTKTEFLNNMSHELRTPLNAVIGFSDMMMNEFLGPIGNEAYRGYARDIHDSGNYLLSIINDILDVSRIESGTMELEETEFEISDMIQSCVEMIRVRASERHLKLKTEIEPQMPWLRADNRRLKQILLNLLSNAIKFTPQGGVITIRAYLGAGGCPCLEVQDTGIGIDPDNIGTVLEPFGKVETAMVRQHEGIGLGLPIVKAMVEQHGGRLEILSQLGEGVTVRVTLPRERALSKAG
ncbi:PAS domain S-box protein [Aestuariispira insulae]|uniref:histidine kinase n=1 Tax=Aestuariispira insulae TaxID=1461337 RepID=A0A3D9HS98_9PROT|nr:PAS domain S-box protein [Aestuariispira insulae]RED52295.1 PAS domain S-box-containing protein [Aestuariispira insulae]